MVALGSQTWAQSANDEFWPEVYTYFHLNEPTRVYLLTKSSNSEETCPGQGDLGLHLDFPPKPAVQARVGTRDDVFEKR